MTDRPASDSRSFLDHDGPLPRETALAALDRAAELMTTADFADAARLYQRVIGFDDPAVTGAAMLGLGEALHRLDRDADALGTWEAVTQLPESPATYPAWRNVAAARVRAGDLAGAVDAYRQAERRAPSSDKPEIASRLGWLSKELGDRRASGRYFARARGDVGVSVSVVIIAVTTVVSLTTDFTGRDGVDLLHLLWMDKVALAAGEVWRLWTVALVHAPFLEAPFHLLFNMYALWLAGPLVERLYGRRLFLLLYLLFAAAGSVATFSLGSVGPQTRFGVGASGAIFGLFGMLFAAQQVHRPVVDRQSRAFLGQLGMLLVLNLALGFAISGIDILAHLGGLVAGLWLGALIAPTQVPTLRSMWQRPGVPAAATQGAIGSGNMALIRIAGVLLLIAAIAALYALGISAWG